MTDSIRNWGGVWAFGQIHVLFAALLFNIHSAFAISSKRHFFYLGLLLNTQSTITTTAASTFLATRKYIQQVEMHLIWCNSILTSGGGLKFSQGKNRCRRIFLVLFIERWTRRLRLVTTQSTWKPSSSSQCWSNVWHELVVTCYFC